MKINYDKKLTKILLPLVIGVSLVVIGIYFVNRLAGDEPIKEITNSENKKGEVSKKIKDKNKKDIMITDGMKHTVPLEEIKDGGPPKDGIPSIDDPKFISPSEAQDWLKEDEPGIAVSINGVSRFYPYKILVWHEIVNDKIKGDRILVTYCPLCMTGFVFDPVVKNQEVEFGTSGKLWKSNLVMYDRKTDSLWSQVLGESIAGEMSGTELKKIPSDQIRFGEWKEEFSGGEVLSRDTETNRSYGANPYGDYSSVSNIALSMTNHEDDRLPNDQLVFGIEVNGKAKAYSIEAVKEKGKVQDEFQGQTFVLKHDPKKDVVRMYKEQENGELKRIAPTSGFWFSWVAAYPDTKLFK